jgi:hypothetical protein
VISSHPRERTSAAAGQAERKQRSFLFLAGLILSALKSVRAKL